MMSLKTLQFLKIFSDEISNNIKMKCILYNQINQYFEYLHNSENFPNDQ